MPSLTRREKPFAGLMGGGLHECGAAFPAPTLPFRCLSGRVSCASRFRCRRSSIRDHPDIAAAALRAAWRREWNIGTLAQGMSQAIDGSGSECVAAVAAGVVRCVRWFDRHGLSLLLRRAWQDARGLKKSRHPAFAGCLCPLCLLSGLPRRGVGANVTGPGSPAPRSGRPRA